MTSVLQYDAFIPPQRGFNYMSNERLVAAANQFKRLLLDNKLLVVAVVCTTVYLGILDKVLERSSVLAHRRKPSATLAYAHHGKLFQFGNACHHRGALGPSNRLCTGKKSWIMHGHKPNTGSCPKPGNEGNRATPPTRRLSPC